MSDKQCLALGYLIAAIIWPIIMFWLGGFWALMFILAIVIPVHFIEKRDPWLARMTQARGLGRTDSDDPPTRPRAVGK